MSRSYNKDNVFLVLRKIANRITIRKAAADYRVLHSTFQNRINKRLLYGKGHEIYQKIVLFQEKRLTDWILVQKNLGINPSHC